MRRVFSANPQGDDPNPWSLRGKRALIPVLICAILSVLLMRTGFLSFLFLVPLGFSAVAYNPAAAWFAFVLAAILNGALSLGFSLYYQSGAVGFALDILHFTVLTLGFTWIMTGGTNGLFLPRIRTMYRFIAAAVAGGAAFLIVGYVTRSSAGFAALVQSQAEMLSSAYISSSGADAVRRSFLEHFLTPDTVMEAITLVALRGGALALVFILLFVNRQISLSLAWIFRRRRSAQSLSNFHVPANAIWGLSLSLAAVLLGKIAGLVIPEIIAWNVLVICVILFLAQGGGIALYTLTRRPLPPMMRLLCNVLIIVVVFSPGINTFALGLLILLGIAENWLPLRAPKQDGPASTPGP
jgi:hypothetical protein